MRVVVLEGPKQLHVRDRPDPRPAAGEVLIDVVSTGVCGTDVSIYRGKIAVDYPRILGHEMAGRITALGEGVVGSEFEVGSHVIVNPSIDCGSCYQCSRGQSNLCIRGVLMGRDADGSFCQRLVAPAGNVYLLPDDIPLTVAPLIQVLTVCLHGQRMADVFPAEGVAVIGLGVTGLLHVQLAKARGANPVIGITRNPTKRQLAKQLGADIILDGGDPDVVNRAIDVTGGRGPDLVIESAGIPETLSQAIDLVRIGGRIMLFGTITDNQAELPFYQLYYREIAITNPRAAKAEDFPAAIAMVASKSVALTPIVTNTFPFEQTPQAIAASDDPSTLKVVIEHTDAA